MTTNGERLYREAATILQHMEGKRGSIRSLVFSKHLNIRNKAVFPLVHKTLSKKREILDVIEKSEILKRLPKITVHQLLVMLYDELYGDGLRKRGPMTRAVIKHRSEIRHVFNSSTETTKQHHSSDKEKCGVPVRYARVNLLRTDMSEVLQHLTASGFTQTESESIMVSSSDDEVFARDADIPTLLVFPASVLLSKMDMYLSTQLIIQDKASCLPAHLLQPPPGSAVMDACAAPGNKTSHLAAIMNNTGCVYAVDKDLQRYKAMKRYLKKCGATCVTCLHCDFFKVSPSDYEDVEYMLVDPSCSGSGIVGRVDYEQNDSSCQSERLQGLSRFQASILKHALSFPSVKRLVYSTCSVHKEENECVVRDALVNYGSQYELEHIMPHWTSRGQEVEDFPKDLAQKCLRVWPEVHKAHGFFVAVFLRSHLSDKK